MEKTPPRWYDWILQCVLLYCIVIYYVSQCAPALSWSHIVIIDLYL